MQAANGTYEAREFNETGTLLREVVNDPFGGGFEKIYATDGKLINTVNFTPNTRDECREDGTVIKEKLGDYGDFGISVSSPQKNSIEALYGNWNSEELVGNSSTKFLAAGGGNDDVHIASETIVAFNRGDGHDIVSSSGFRNLISIGGGIGYSDLALKKEGSDLVILVGGADTLRLDKWYTSGHFVDKIQLIFDSQTHPRPGNPDSESQLVDFSDLLEAFEKELSGGSTAASWNIEEYLIIANANQSESETVGGDLSLSYGKFGSPPEHELLIQSLLNESFGIVGQPAAAVE